MKKASKPIKIFFWLLALGLFANVLSSISAAELRQILEILNGWHFLGLFLINSGVLFFSAARKRLFLSSFGYTIPYWALIRYRLAGFFVSYITPGPHFGGEPLEIYMLSQEHQVNSSANIAALALDKSSDMALNFVMLLSGGLYTLLIVMPGEASATGYAAFIAAPLVLAIAIIAYFACLRRNRRPLTALRGAIAKKSLRRGWIQGAERQMSLLLRHRPGLFWLGMMLSALIWVFLLAEYFFLLTIVAPGSGLAETVVLLTATRLGMLTPLPGGIGAIESAQLWAALSLGMAGEAGVALSLLIRLRDLALCAGAIAFGRIRKNPQGAG